MLPYDASMPRIPLKKSDMDGQMLGPPRNALLWQRAREMASMSRPNPSFSDILQAYQMVCLAPGFNVVSSFGKGQKLKGAQFPGGGLWKWAHKEAKRRGKPKSYAAAIANKVMGKALPASLDIDTDPLARVRAGYQDNTGAKLKDMVSTLFDSCSPTPLPPPSRQVGNIVEALADVDMPDDLRDDAHRAISVVLQDATSAMQAAAVSGQVLQAIPNLSGVQRKEIGLRIAFLHSLGVGVA